MINSVQQHTNQNISFEGANFRFARGQAQKFKSYVQEEAVNVMAKRGSYRFGVLPYFLDKKGEFDVRKFAKQVNAEFIDVDSYEGTYVFDNFRKGKNNRVRASLIHIDSNGQEVAKDRFTFNPTHLFKKATPKSKYLNTMELFNNMEAWNCGAKHQKQIREEYSKNIWDMWA